MDEDTWYETLEKLKISYDKANKEKWMITAKKNPEIWVQRIKDSEEFWKGFLLPNDVDHVMDDAKLFLAFAAK